MPRAVSVIDGKLTEVFVVELGVYKNSAGFYTELKPNSNLLRIGNKKVQVLTEGWYRVKNARPKFWSVGDEKTLSTTNTYISGPYA